MPFIRNVESDAFGCSDLWDRHEALTLATVLEHINKDDLSTAVDVITMRLLCLQEAKQKGTVTGEKACLKELVPMPGATGLQPACLSSLV